MTQTQHTAETWHIAATTIDDEIIILNDCDSVVATVPLWKDEDCDDGFEQQSRRNAALIAIAPELLAAAQVALDYLTDHAIDLDGEPEELLAGIRIDLADAIHSAKGDGA